MNRENFKKINKIIERESKTASYKFALLRATIEIAEKYDHLALRTSNDRIHLPTGLLVEKWLAYYYPLLSRLGSLRHATNGNLAFEKAFSPIIEFYENKEGGGFPSFYNDMTEGKYPNLINEEVRKLTENIRSTIEKQPMQYIGSSLTEGKVYYNIYHRENKKTPVKQNETIDHELLLRKFGTFSIPAWYYETLRYFGSFLSGQESLLVQWAEFTWSINRGTASREINNRNQILESLLESPEKERNVKEVEKLLKKRGTNYCLWSGKKVTNKTLNVDHCIPFSVYLNNDLWNLVPSHNSINQKKSDRIPTRELLEKRKDLLFEHWRDLEDDSTLNKRFREEMEMSLAGQEITQKEDFEVAYKNLLKKCEFYIEEKGMMPFDG